MIMLVLRHLHIPWWSVFAFWYLLYFFMAAGAYLNGYGMEYLGWRHPGRPGKIHKVIHRWHTGLHVDPSRSFGDEKYGAGRVSGRSGPAAQEGLLVTFSPWTRAQRAWRNNAITFAVLTLLACMTVNPAGTVRVIVIFLTFSIAGLIALAIRRARHRRLAGRVVGRPAPYVSRPVPAPGSGTVTTASTAVIAEEQSPKLEGVPQTVLATLLSTRLGCSTAEVLARLDMTQERGKLRLPDTFGALIKEREPVQECIEAHTEGKVRFSWLTTQSPRMLEWFPVIEHKLPKTVRFRDHLPQLEALGPREFGIGLEANRDMYVTTHNGDKPWHCRFAGSGTGKSTGFLVKAAQICRKDPKAELYCIDTKQVSFEALHGIPRVYIYDNPQSAMKDIWDVFYTLGGIMRDRYAAIREGRARPEDFNDIWVLIDEGTDLASNLKSYNKNVLGATTASPPIWGEAIGPLFRLGRQARIFGEFMTQDLDGRIFGGESLKSAFGVFGAAGYLPQQFVRTVGSPVEECLEGPGRILMCVGNKRKWVQGFYDDEQWLHDYALANRRK